jgi:hypothetical protein
MSNHDARVMSVAINFLVNPGQMQIYKLLDSVGEARWCENVDAYFAIWAAHEGKIAECLYFTREYYKNLNKE